MSLEKNTPILDPFVVVPVPTLLGIAMGDLIIVDAEAAPAVVRREDLERVAAGGAPEAVEMIALRDGEPRDRAFRVPLDSLRDVCRGSKILGFSPGRVWFWDAASAAS